MSGRFGVMVHFLLPGPAPLYAANQLDDPDAIVERFDVARFVDNVARTGASWILFTFGQNSGHYASPNRTIERRASAARCTRRDLVLEIAREAKSRGLRFIGYLPCEVNANIALHAGFQWDPTPGSDQSRFQQLYVEAVAEWGERFGDLMDGWWFDGCFAWDAFHNRHMNWPLWHEAARAGHASR
jgi:hypothetical protein